jgi:sensor histidine kinase YesM
MGKGGDFSSLREEVQSVEHYLSIQNLRFGGRFHLKTVIPEEALDVEVLRFMLQPIVENCVVHGYEGAAGEGVIDICASLSDSTLSVIVSDRGVGVNQSMQEQKTAQETIGKAGQAKDEAVRDAGLGLRNVRDMLSITYGPAAALALFSREGGGASVRICLPLRTGGTP